MSRGYVWRGDSPPAKRALETLKNGSPKQMAGACSKVQLAGEVARLRECVLRLEAHLEASANYAEKKSGALRVADEAIKRLRRKLAETRVIDAALSQELKED